MARNFWGLEIEDVITIEDFLAGKTISYEEIITGQKRLQTISVEELRQITKSGIRILTEKDQGLYFAIVQEYWRLAS